MALNMLSVPDAEGNYENKSELPLGQLGALVKTTSTAVPKIVIPHDPSQTLDVYPWFEVTMREINVPGQTFTCSVECYLFWQEYGLPTAFPDFANEEFLLTDDDVPVKIAEVFENKISHNFENTPTYKYFPETSCLQMTWVSECVFTERMELNRFPLDRQFLNMLFNGWTKTDKVNWNWVMIAPDWVPKEFHKPIFVRMVSSITEYELLSPWVDFSMDEAPMKIRLRVDRIPSFYFGNVVFPNFLIVAGCFSAFVIPANDVADRLALNVTLMLAAVAFRFVISTMLPKVSYLTLLDYYIIVGFVALTILIGENAICGISTLDQETTFAIDFLFGACFGAAWIMLHLVSLYCLSNKNFLRKSWEAMDLLDSQEDPDAEWTKVETVNLHSKTETDESKQAWERYKNKSADKRADAYAEDNPSFLKQLNAMQGGMNAHAE